MVARLINVGLGDLNTHATALMKAQEEEACRAVRNNMSPFFDENTNSFLVKYLTF